MKTDLVESDSIRAALVGALSDLYASEMPRYRAMAQLVVEVNRETLAANPELERDLRKSGELDSLHVARHGAIRVGSAQELSTVRRMFAVTGMFPVGYYNLAPAGLPVHSTAFRPIDEGALRRSPFRVFASLLRIDLIDDPEARREASALLDGRDILTPRCRSLLEQFEREGGLNENCAREFVLEAIETFRWRGEATVSVERYERLKAAHPLIADIACFKGPHINHLTLRTLDIDAAQRAMAARGMGPKATIEGPPRRRCPILLRQTSFRALPEPISFPDAHQPRGVHTARFGEIEQRGVALTDKGRAFYNRLLADAHARARGNAESETSELRSSFEGFPDDETELSREGLAFYKFHPTATGLASAGDTPLPREVDHLVAGGFVGLEPIIYEDFLPVSAAGIFRSNLSEDGKGKPIETDDRHGFEESLGMRVIDPAALYRKAQTASLVETLDALGLADTLAQGKST